VGDRLRGLRPPGLTVEQVAQQLQAAWLGEVATELRLLDRTIPVRVRYPDDIRLDPHRLAQTTVRGADGKVATIGSLARATESGAEPIMQRENLRQMATVTARLEGRDLGSGVKEIKSILAGVKLPSATRSKWAASTNHSARPSASCCWCWASRPRWCWWCS
jgi:multidrug efflux pump subunit AcrB